MRFVESLSLHCAGGEARRHVTPEGVVNRGRWESVGTAAKDALAIRGPDTPPIDDDL